MEELEISRGNTSMNLRNLIDWGIVRRTAQPGSRKEYFSTETDLWTMFHLIARERKKREFDPLLSRMDICLAQAGDHPENAETAAGHKAYTAKVKDLRAFFATFQKLFDRLLNTPPGEIAELVAQLDKMLG